MTMRLRSQRRRVRPRLGGGSVRAFGINAQGVGPARRNMGSLRRFLKFLLLSGVAAHLQGGRRWHRNQKAIRVA